MRILALDPGRRTGWHVSEHGRPLAGGVWTMPQERSRAPRLLAWKSWLEGVLDEFGPAVVVLEQATQAARGSEVKLLLGGCQIMAEIVAWERNLLLDPVPPARWQAWARRNAGWSREKKEDAADALYIARWWWAVRAPIVRVRPEEGAGSPQGARNGKGGKGGTGTW